MTWLDPLSKAFLFAAAVLAWLVVRRRLGHHLVALALSSSLILDIVRAYSSDDLSEMLYIAYPTVSAWCALRVLGRFDAATSCLCVIVAPFTGLSPFASGLALQAFAAAMFLMSGRDVAISEKCCIILFAGDAAALLGPLAWGGPWWMVQGQAVLVSLLLGLVQLRALRLAQAGLGNEHPFDDD